MSSISYITLASPETLSADCNNVIELSMFVSLCPVSCVISVLFYTSVRKKETVFIVQSDKPISLPSKMKSYDCICWMSSEK